MQRDKILSIITIICFCSVVLIPIGIAIMWFSTQWNKKIKLILSTSLSTLYVILFICIMLLNPSSNSSGLSVPIDYSKGSTEFNTEMPSGGKKTEKAESEYKSESWKSSDSKTSEEEPEHLPKSLKKKSGGSGLSILFPILFFLVIMLLVIRQNLKYAKKKTGYENPYVDTNQYKLPLADDAKMPLVHFLKLRLNQGEKIFFATETNQKNNEGNMIITNQRVVLINMESGEIDFPLEALEAVSSVSNSVIQLISGERKYFIFVPENQMKYALAVLRWSYKHQGEK